MFESLCLYIHVVREITSIRLLQAGPSFLEIRGCPQVRLSEYHKHTVRSEAICNDGFGDRAERQTELIPVSLGGVMPRGRREDNNKGQRSGNYPRSSKSISPKDGTDKWRSSMHSDIRKQGTR
jgi:hypothetical protein